MPFGLMNAPSTFQRMMERILSDLGLVCTYFDDVVVFSRDIQVHDMHLRQVFRCISAHKLKMKLSKCFFCKDRVEILGHILAKEGVSVDPKNIETIESTPVQQPVLSFNVYWVWTDTIAAS